MLEQIYDACHSGDGLPPPLVVAPALSLHETQNVLAIGYARWLANEMGWQDDRRIFQTKTVNRDFTTSSWFRLVHQPTFKGDVERGRRYVIADDVSTMGGTVASLRGFIESKGGRVICATVIASGVGSNVPISLAPETLTGLTSALGGGLAAICDAEFGYAVSCLTEAEGRFLLRCPSLDELRAGIDGARNA